MKTTLTVSRRGVVILPARLCDALGISANGHIIAETTPEGVLLRPTVTLPVEMYSAKRVREFDNAEADLATMPKIKAPMRTVAKAVRKPVTRKSVRLR